MRPLLREPEAAELLGCSVRWLQVARVNGNGPPYAKIGRSVRYDPDTLEQSVKSRTIENTAQTPGGD